MKCGALYVQDNLFLNLLCSIFILFLGFCSCWSPKGSNANGNPILRS